MILPGHRGAEVMKPAENPGKTLMGLVTELIQSPKRDTVSVTLKIPAVVNVCTGFCKLDVLLTPLAGSPKFHKKVVGLPELLSVKFTVKPSQVMGIKFGLAASGLQGSTFTCNSFLLEAIKTPLRYSSIHTVNTYSPLEVIDGAIPLTSPVTGFIVTAEPSGCEPLKGNV